MRIFVNNVDGYLAGAICADLWKLSHSIIGTRKGRSDHLVPPVVKKIVPRVEVRKMLKAITSCDVIVYDLHDADLEELELLLRMLHMSELSQDVTFILVSSVGCWARTSRDYEKMPQPPAPEPPAEAPSAGEEGEEAPAAEVEEGARRVSTSREGPQIRPVQLRSEDYIRRAAAPKFQEWKSIEALTLALKDGRKETYVSPYVVCAGIPYGNGEDRLLGLFKAAWMGRDTHRVINTGHNFVPCVHCRDIARLVRRIVEVKPDLPYHIACDKVDLTQRQIIQAVKDDLGPKAGTPVPSITNAEAVMAELADMLTLDLRFEPSYLMSSGTGEKAEKPFPWWCPDGFAASIRRISTEFVRWRRLSTVRFCILAPPGAGGGQLAEMLASRYNVPLASYDALLEEHKNAETPLGQALREKFDEIAKILENPKAPPPPPIPAALTCQVIEEGVKGNATRHRGLALAGYPVTVEDAKLLFLEDPPAKHQDPTLRQEVQGIPDKPPPVSEGEKIWRVQTAPDLLIMLKSSEEQCLARYLESKPDGEAEFKRESERWRKENPEDAQTPLLDFFKERGGIEPIQFNVDEMDLSTVMTEIADALKEKKTVYNFLPPGLPPKPGTTGDQADEEGLVGDTMPGEDEEAKQREAEEQRLKEEEAERLDHIKREEFIRLEKNSEPLRQYFMTFVVPTLTAGLIEICAEVPEDPVGYLAEYLAAHAQDAAAAIAASVKTPEHAQHSPATGSNGTATRPRRPSIQGEQKD
eukprot:gnl/TRDRNA2_/TRDRNA2_58719_c0_seq1.p1 gnl/TRDRNA2_/TRDRNA2_58719_c0~~gnl/TRDRNA2_/TRDRNA2_58719_c0_seq1.p1  ORF type:complete len:753 (+),score=183.93 gnl/TRDRNA2_/TRDRNA2_58719_c0_seq1:131-2389(+)